MVEDVRIKVLKGNAWSGRNSSSVDFKTKMKHTKNKTKFVLDYIGKWAIWSIESIWFSRSLIDASFIEDPFLSIAASCHLHKSFVDTKWSLLIALSPRLEIVTFDLFSLVLSTRCGISIEVAIAFEGNCLKCVGYSRGFVELKRQWTFLRNFMFLKSFFIKSFKK